MIIQILIIIIYSTALFLIFMYALAQLNLLFNYLSSKKHKKEDHGPNYDLSNPAEIPNVTIQLPVYNELYVMERLLDNIAQMDYPKDNELWELHP